VTHGADSMAEGLDPDGPVSGELRGRTPVVSVGRSLPGVTIVVRDDEGREVPDGVVGEILIRAPFLALGYVGESDDVDAFQDGWYRTGDLGYLARGHLYVTGRKKDVLIIAGTNVYPEDIESVVTLAPGWRDGRAAAFAVFDERTQTDTVTVLAEPEDAGTQPDLLGAMRAVQAELQVSIRLHAVEPGWLIKSSSGKISRSASSRKWAALLADRGLGG
jgi:fatty-acyl-CoA synthase